MCLGILKELFFQGFFLGITSISFISFKISFKSILPFDPSSKEIDKLDFFLFKEKLVIFVDYFDPQNFYLIIAPSTKAEL